MSLSLSIPHISLSLCQQMGSQECWGHQDPMVHLVQRVSSGLTGHRVHQGEVESLAKVAAMDPQVEMELLVSREQGGSVESPESL